MVSRAEMKAQKRERLREMIASRMAAAPRKAVRIEVLEGRRGLTKVIMRRILEGADEVRQGGSVSPV